MFWTKYRNHTSRFLSTSPPKTLENSVLELFVWPPLFLKLRHFLWSLNSDNGLGATRDHTFPTLYEGEST